MTERLLFRADVVEVVCDCESCQVREGGPIITHELRYSPSGRKWSQMPAEQKLIVVGAVAQLGSVAGRGCPDLSIGGDPRGTPDEEGLLG